MDLSTIPDNIWTACSIKAESVLEQPWAGYSGIHTKNLENRQVRDVFRKNVPEAVRCITPVVK